MKRVVFMMTIMLYAITAWSQISEINPEQWHRIYRESVHGKHYAELQRDNEPDSLLLFVQNNKPQITRDDEEWYEPDTITMFNPYWERRDIITYNEQGFKSIIIHQEMWYGMVPELQTYARSIYTYNDDNRILFLTGQVLLEDETWGNYQMFSHAYDYNGNETSFLVQDWNGQNWGNYYRIVSDYDSQSNLLSRYLQLWEGNDWQYYDDYYTYTYDANNNRLSALTQYWSNNDWKNHKLSSYTYNEKNNNDTIVNQIWDNDENIWRNDDRFTYLYDNRGNKKESFHDYWQNNVWLNHQNTIYEYDDNNNMLSFIIIFWQGGIWVNECQYIYTYDSLNNVLSQTRLQFDKINNAWENWERYIYIYNESNSLQTSIWQSGLGNEWVNKSRVIYDYDDDNNNTSTLGQLWTNDVWQDDELTEYKYDEHGNCLSGDLWKWNNNGWVTSYAYELEITYNHAQCTIGGEYYCRNISASYVKTPKPVIAIEDVEKEEVDIFVYPNPTAGILYVETHNYASVRNIEVFDVFGRNVLTVPVETHGRASLQQQPTTTIDISYLPTGMYFVQIQTENGVVTRKVVKR